MLPHHDDPALPKQSLWLYRWFLWYCRKFACKHFHAVRLSRSSHALPAFDGKPLLFVMNHPSWWDVIIGVFLSGRFPAYRHYAPIEAAMLSKYRFFSRLGFFGIDATPRGAAHFADLENAI